MVPDVFDVCVFFFFKVFHSSWQFQDDYFSGGSDLDISVDAKMVN